MGLTRLTASVFICVFALFLVGAGSGDDDRPSYPSPFDKTDERLATLVSVFVNGDHENSEHLLQSAQVQELDGRMFIVGKGVAIGKQKTIESNATVWIAWDSVVRIIPWSNEQFHENMNYRR